MQFTVEPMSESDIPGTFEVIKSAFDRFVAPGYCKEGVQHFYEFACVNAMKSRMDTNIFFVAKETERKKVIGMIELRDKRHICLLFTDPDYHRNGVASALFKAALLKCESTAIFEVNASPYAVPVYERLGFTQVMPEQLKDGIHFVPMERAGRIKS